jgi:hypothetical protein
MSLSKYGWLISRNHRNLFRFIQSSFQDIFQLENRIAWGNISGGYKQYDFMNHPNKAIRKITKSILDQLEREVKEILLQEGYSASFLQDKCLRHLKILEAPPGSLGQVSHRDSLHRDTFVVALYLTTHASTEFCIYPREARNIKEMNKETKQSLNIRHWFDFVSFQCDPGDLSIFHEDIIHRGPPNLTKHTRYVLFTVLKPKGLRHSDKYQYYAWNQVKEAFGGHSPQYKQLLCDQAFYRPYDHHSGKEKEKVRKICSGAKTSMQNKKKRRF